MKKEKSLYKPMTKKLAVIGFPIKHSLSPEIHNYWIDQCGVDAVYEKIEVAPDGLDEFLKNMQNDGYIGCNVTVPNKEAVFDYIEKNGTLTGIARKIGAVNTVYFENGEIRGTNTDAIGFTKNVISGTDSEFKFKDKNCFVLGAGGAARAVIFGILERDVKQVILSNRTKEKAQKLKSEMAYYADKIKIVNWDEKENHLNDIDFLVNTTSLGMDGQNSLEIDLEKLPSRVVVNDIVYKPLMTDLLKQAQDNGNKTVDGLGMLLYQARESFSTWFREEIKQRGVPPTVTDDLRELVLKK